MPLLTARHPARVETPVIEIKNIRASLRIEASVRDYGRGRTWMLLK